MGVLEQVFARPAQKAVVGPGAYAMEYGTPLWTKDRDDRKFIREALGIYRTSRHIRRAEDTISNRIAGVPWHLEDDDGNEVGDEAPEQLQTLRNLIEKP